MKYIVTIVKHVEAKDTELARSKAVYGITYNEKDTVTIVEDDEEIPVRGGIYE